MNVSRPLAPPDALQLSLTTVGTALGHDPLRRVLAAYEAAQTLSDDSTAETMLATYQKIYEEIS